jgi:hypothetical protein
MCATTLSLGPASSNRKSKVWGLNPENARYTSLEAGTTVTAVARWGGQTTPGGQFWVWLLAPFNLTQRAAYPRVKLRSEGEGGGRKHTTSPQTSTHTHTPVQEPGAVQSCCHACRHGCWAPTIIVKALDNKVAVPPGAVKGLRACGVAAVSRPTWSPRGTGQPQTRMCTAPPNSTLAVEARHPTSRCLVANWKC